MFIPRQGQIEKTTTNIDTAVKIPLVQVFWHWLMGVLGYGFYLGLVFLIREYALGMAIGVLAIFIALVAVAMTAPASRLWVLGLSTVGIIVTTGTVFEYGPAILDALMWDHWQWFFVPVFLLGLESIFYGRYRFRGEAVDPHGMSPTRTATAYTGLEYPLRWLVEALLERGTP